MSDLCTDSFHLRRALFIVFPQYCVRMLEGFKVVG